MEIAMPVRPQSASRAVLITGCSSGIGMATALRLARSERWNVWASARRVESLRELAAAGCRTLALDVTDDASMVDAVAEVEAADGAVSALVNNAGYQLTGAVESVAGDELRRQFETNVFGPVRLVQLVAPGMRRQGWGRIVNLSSMGGRLTFPGGGAYHGTKHALEALSDALRYELEAFGIDVAIIEPGLIRTEFANAAIGNLPTTATANDPYAKFNAGIREAYAGMEAGVVRLVSSDADAVARAIERAVEAPRPRTRHVVSPSARIFLGLRALTSDRTWDRIMGGMIPRPEATR
jgi:NAD(P)-dependent dehydrogenase (short-subunit alcohol dehydrogenase family)